MAQPLRAQQLGRAPSAAESLDEEAPYSGAEVWPARSEAAGIARAESTKVYSEDLLPPLHLYAYIGDLKGVLQCITDGHKVHDTVIMRNQDGKLVCEITPLFLAAQRGHYKLVKLLVEQGANPGQPAYIQDSTDLCTPLQVARLNLHLKVVMYLKKMVKARKAEDKVLKAEEAEQQQQQQAGNAPHLRGTEAFAVTAAAVQTPQLAAMQNLKDLKDWDPRSGAQPQVQNGNLIARMLKRNKVDLMTWRPDMERTLAGGEEMRASAHRAVDPGELEGLEVVNHSSLLNNYLQDADLARWNPEAEADDAQSARGAPATSVAATGRRSLDLDNNYNNYGSAVGGGSDSNSLRNESPTPALRQQHLQGVSPSPYTTQHLHSRAAGAAAAAVAARGSNFTPTQSKAPARVVATRWYAHGGSDSDEDEDDYQASASLPAAAPVPLPA